MLKLKYILLQKLSNHFKNLNSGIYSIETAKRAFKTKPLEFNYIPLLTKSIKSNINIKNGKNFVLLKVVRIQRFWRNINDISMRTSIDRDPNRKNSLVKTKKKSNFLKSNLLSNNTLLKYNEDQSPFKSSKIGRAHV